MKHRPLGDLVDLAVQLQRDADEPQAALHQRDRLLLTGLPQLPAEPRERLQFWLEQMRAAGQELPGHRVSAGYRLLLLALGLLGVLIGGVVASVVFHYDGVRPVNVVHVVAVFVAAQLALLVLLGVVMLPASWLRRIPGALTVQESLATLSPGQAVRLLLRRLPGRLREAVAGPARSVAWYHGAFETVWKWAVIAAAQVFAVAFNAGALAASLYLVTFSDLAFAWSTTLEPDVARVHRLTQALATPWTRVAPAAVPSPELIRSTLYYRSEPMSAGSRPERWGGWWPFLVAAMVTYGALPRLLLLAVSAAQLRRQLKRSLTNSPGATLVLERLGSAWVSTQATADDTGPVPAPDGVATAATDLLPGGGPIQLVNWGGIAVEDAALRVQFSRDWHRPVSVVRHAGGRSSLAADDETVAALAGVLPEPQAGRARLLPSRDEVQEASARQEPRPAGLTVAGHGGQAEGPPPDTAMVMLVKGWEPPLLDCLDFLQALRAACGRHRWIVVVPLALGAGGVVQPCAGPGFNVWQRKLRSLGDPALAVQPWPSAHEAAA